ARRSGITGTGTSRGARASDCSISPSTLSCVCDSAGGGCRFDGRVDGRHVDLAHRVEDPHRGGGSLGVAGDLGPVGRTHLPRQPELVLQPTAHALLATIGGELVPVVVDLLLVLAVDDERDRFVEGELRATVDRGELVPVEHERYGEHFTRGSRP